MIPDWEKSDKWEKAEYIAELRAERKRIEQEHGNRWGER